MIFTEELFKQVAPTENFTRAQMAVFGEPWPQIAGWKKRIIGAEINQDHLNALLTFRKQLDERKTAKHGYRGKTKREHKKENAELCANLSQIQPVILTNIKIQDSVSARIYLNVPYSDKDEAKSLGAKWDKEAKKWYATGDISAFYKWVKI